MNVSTRQARLAQITAGGAGRNALSPKRKACHSAQIVAITERDHPATEQLRWPHVAARPP